MDTALKLFADRGVEATSLKDIAAEVGISEPAVYRHFSSKAQLVWQIFSDGYCGLAETLDQAQQAEPTLRGKLDRIIEVYCHLHDTNEALFRFLFLTQHGQLARLTPDMPTPVDVVARVVNEGMARGAIPPRDPQLLTAILFGLVTQPAVFHIYGRLTGKMSAYRQTLAAAAWATISFEEVRP
jgi:AcrR family transcriptional regulator